MDLRSRIVLVSLTLAVAGGLAACSETLSTTDAGADAGTPAADAAGTDAAPGKDGGGFDGAFDASALQGIVFNELSATGGDWVELYNTTSSPVDVAGAKIADNEVDASAPRLGGALQFLAGTIVAPGGYLVVLANEKTASATPIPCFDGGTCPAVDWGISKDKPNTIYLLDPKDQVLLQADMPANAHVDGQSWGRFPNGTGSFGARATPTPAAANVQ